MSPATLQLFRALLTRHMEMLAADVARGDLSEWGRKNYRLMAAQAEVASLELERAEMEALKQ